MQPQIVHEAEVHRQHVRLKIPIQVEIDGVRYQIDDWSMGGFGIESEVASRQPGEKFTAKLTFPFEDFDVAMRLDCQMVYVLSDASRFGCRFVALTKDQVALFRYLIDAYLSGEVVSAGDILSVRARDNTAQARLDALAADPFAAEDSTGRRIKRYAGYGLLGLAGLALAALVVLGVQERFLTLEATAAVVDAPIHRVRAPAAGSLQPLTIGDPVRPGQTVAYVETLEFGVVPVLSPCACILLQWLALDGEYVQEGEAVLALAASDQPVTVRAEVPVGTVERLQIGDRAEIRLLGRGAPISGQIERIDTRLPLVDGRPGGRQVAQVVIRPDQPLALDDLGTPARVRFR